MKPPFNKVFTEKTKGTSVRESVQRDLKPKSTVVVVWWGDALHCTALVFPPLSCSGWELEEEKWLTL